jgi:hypothetical protein
LKIKCLYSYYSGGVYCELGYVDYYDHGSTDSSTNSTPVMNFLIQQNQTLTQNLGLNGNIGTALQSGACRSLQFGPGAIAPWQDYYGSFDSGTNGVTPELIVNYAETNGSTAGTGGTGKCIITYNNGTVPTYALSVSAQQSTDSFGNPYNAGFTGPQMTFTPVTNLQTTVSTAMNLGSNSTGTALQSTSAPQNTASTGGITGTLPAVQIDLNAYTVNVNSSAVNMTKAWLLPAGDPQLGTQYEIYSEWYGVFNNSSINNWGFNHGTVSSTTAFTNIVPVGAAATTNGDAVAGWVKLTLTCVTAGSSGAMLYSMEGQFQDASVNRINTDIAQLVGIGTLSSFNCNNNNTIAIAFETTAGTTNMVGRINRMIRYGP